MLVNVWGVGSGLCKRKNTSAQINNIQIDAGPNVYMDILNNFSQHILITHPHGDHIGGLWSVVLVGTLKYNVDVHIYGSSFTLERVKPVIELQSDEKAYSMMEKHIIYHTLPEEGSITINNTKIEFTMRHHIGEIYTHIFKFDNRVVWAKISTKQ